MVLLDDAPREIAAQMARERGLKCPQCSSLDLEAEDRADWVTGAQLRILLWCADPTHSPYEQLYISNEEARQRLGVTPQTS